MISTRLVHLLVCIACIGLSDQNPDAKLIPEEADIETGGRDVQNEAAGQLLDAMASLRKFEIKVRNHRKSSHQAHGYVYTGDTQMEGRSELTSRGERSSLAEPEAFFERVNKTPPFYRDLSPVSNPVDVFIRARGYNDLYVVLIEGVLVMSRISLSQMSQAIFMMRKYFDDSQLTEVTSFYHKSTKSYLSVSRDTKEVQLVQVADPKQKPGPSCLFLVTGLGHAVIRPVLFPDMSLKFASKDNKRLIVESGRHCMLSISFAN